MSIDLKVCAASCAKILGSNTHSATSSCVSSASWCRCRQCDVTLLTGKMYIANSNGPRTFPWRISDRHVTGDDRDVPMLT